MKWLVAGLLLSALTWAVASIIRSNGPGGDGVLARLDDPDGATYLVTQEWNDWCEPYRVSFYRREPDGRWGWYYIDHQSDRWRSVRLDRNAREQSVRVMRDGRLIAEYSTSSASFSLFDDAGRRVRKLAAPQYWDFDLTFDPRGDEQLIRPVSRVRVRAR